MRAFGSHEADVKSAGGNSSSFRTRGPNKQRSRACRMFAPAVTLRDSTTNTDASSRSGVRPVTMRTVHAERRVDRSTIGTPSIGGFVILRRTRLTVGVRNAGSSIEDTTRAGVNKMNGRPAIAPCGHSGEVVIGGYVRCLTLGCDGIRRSAISTCPKCGSSKIEPFNLVRSMLGLDDSERMHCIPCGAVF